MLTCFGLSVTGIVMLTMHDKTIVSMAVKQFNELNGTEKIKFAETLKCCISEQSPKKNTTCQYEEVNCDLSQVNIFVTLTIFL